MQTKRQFLLPLLAAATVMMVSPYAGATAYVFPGYVPGTALVDSDTLTVNSGTISHTANTNTAGATITIASGAKVTTSGNNAVYTAVVGATPLNLIVNGTLAANATSNVALDATAWTLNAADAVAVTVGAGGSLIGDILPSTAANGASNITVNGSWAGNMPTSTTSTAASTLTVSGANAVVTARTSAGLNTPTAANATGYTLKMNNGAKINSNITVTTPGAHALILDVDGGVANAPTHVITGDVVGGAAGNSVLNLGVVDTANAASLTVNGKFDGLKINQQVAGTLQFNGKVGSTNAAGEMTLSAGTTNFKDTAITGVATFSGENQANFSSDYTPTTSLTTQNTASVAISGNLLGTAALSVNDSSKLTVTGNTAVSTFANTTANGVGAVATFNGNFAATGALTLGANTTATFNGAYAQGANSTTAANMNVLGATANLTGGLINTGNLTFGSDKGNVTVALTGGNLLNTSGTITLNQGVSLTSAVTLNATGGTITIGKGVHLTGNATVAGTGVLSFQHGSSTTASVINTSTGTVRVGGQVTISAGDYAPTTGTTEVIFDNSGSGQLVIANGNATFGVSPFKVTYNGGYVAPGVHTVLTASGTLTDSTGAKTLNITNNQSIAAQTLSIAAPVFDVATKKVTVTVTRPKALNTFASESNAQALLASINSVPVDAFQAASAGQKSVLNAIQGLVDTNTTNPSALNTALQAFMPNVSSVAAAKRVVSTAASVLGGRLESLAYGIEAPQAYVAGSHHADAVWMRGAYTRVDQKLNSDTNYNGYTSNQYGSMIGFDTMRFSHATLGLGLGYNQSNSKDRLNRHSVNKVKSYQVLPYGSFNLGDRATRGFIDWFAGYTYNSVKGTRAVGADLGYNTYSYNASMFSAKGTYGLDRVINRNLTLTPFVSALVAYQPSVSYTERGFANTAIQNKSNFGLEFELGVKGVVRPDAGSKANTRIIFRAMGVWSALNNDLKTTATLVGTQSFTYAVSQQKFGAKAGISGVVEVLTDLDLELSYDVEARSKYLSQTGLVEFKYHF